MTEWNRILSKKAYSFEESDAIVVSFVEPLKRRREKTVLDLACGAGRHVVYMAGLGLDAHGSDISETGLKITAKRLEQGRLTAPLVRCALGSLPYVDSCFDAVVCTRAIYHQELHGIQKALAEIRRILKKNGCVLIDFLSKRTYSYRKGERVEEETFVERVGPEKNILHHFTDEEELEALFKAFKSVSFELHEKYVKGKLRSRWTVTAIA